MVVSKPGEPRKKPILNLLSCIQNLPQGLANELSDGDLQAILNFFLFGHEFLNALSSFCRNDQLAMSGLSDLNASARYCVADASEHGLSRWASLQAAEKLLKHYLEKKGATFPYTHNLSRLSQQAYQIGLSQIDESVLHRVQCDASVRYDRDPHNLQEVVDAHHNAMKIGSLVVKTLYPE